MDYHLLAGEVFPDEYIPQITLKAQQLLCNERGGVLSELPHTYLIRDVDGKQAQAVCQTRPHILSEPSLHAYMRASEVMCQCATTCHTCGISVYTN